MQDGGRRVTSSLRSFDCVHFLVSGSICRHYANQRILVEFLQARTGVPEKHDVGKYLASQQSPQTYKENKEGNSGPGLKPLAAMRGEVWGDGLLGFRTIV